MANLFPMHKKDRLAWALGTGTVEDWQKVIWSDEGISRIGLDPTRQRVYWNLPLMTPTYQQVSSQYYVSPVLDLVHSDGIGSEEYMDTLYEGLLYL